MAPDDGRRDGLLAERATSLMHAGRVIDAEREFSDLLSRPHDAGVDAASLTLLGQTMLLAGRPAEALRELARAAQAPQLDNLQRAAGLGWACISRMWLGQLDKALDVADEAGSLAAETGNHVTATISSAMYAVVTQLRGQLLPSLEHIERAVRTADASPGGSAYRYPVHTPHASILVELDRLEDARFVLDRGTRLSQELGMSWHQPSYSMQRVFERYTAGEWDDALTEAEAALELSQESGEHYSVTIVRSLLSWICLHRNDIPRAGVGSGRGAAPDERDRSPLPRALGRAGAGARARSQRRSGRGIRAALGVVGRLRRARDVSGVPGAGR